jgi:hypothetical protein
MIDDTVDRVLPSSRCRTRPQGSPHFYFLGYRSHSICVAHHPLVAPSEQTLQPKALRASCQTIGSLGRTQGSFRPHGSARRPLASARSPVGRRRSRAQPQPSGRASNLASPGTTPIWAAPFRQTSGQGTMNLTDIQVNCPVALARDPAFHCRLKATVPSRKL